MSYVPSLILPRFIFTSLTLSHLPPYIYGVVLSCLMLNYSKRHTPLDVAWTDGYWRRRRKSPNIKQLWKCPDLRSESSLGILPFQFSLPLPHIPGKTWIGSETERTAMRKTVLVGEKERGVWGWDGGREGGLGGRGVGGMDLWWKQEPDSPSSNQAENGRGAHTAIKSRPTYEINPASFPDNLAPLPTFTPLAIIGAKSGSSWKSCYEEENWARNVISCDARYQNEMRKRGVLWCYFAGGGFDGGGKSKKSEKRKLPEYFTGAWQNVTFISIRSHSMTNYLFQIDQHHFVQK